MNIYITPNETEEEFKNIYLTNILNTPSSALYLIKNDPQKEELIFSLKNILPSSPFINNFLILKINFLESSFLSSFDIYIFNVLYFLYFLPKNLFEEKIKLLLENDIYTGNIQSLLDILHTYTPPSQKKIENNLNILNRSYKEKLQSYKSLTRDFQLKNTKIIDHKTYFKFHPSLAPSHPDILNLFTQLIEREFSFVCVCLDELNDYNLRETFNFSDLSDIKFKFIRPFIHLNKKLSIPYKSLLKYERIFYNKKYLFYVNEPSFFPPKNDLINMARNQIMIILEDPTSTFSFSILNLYLDKKKDILQGNINSFNKQLIRDFYNSTPYLKQHFSTDDSQITEYYITGEMEFEKYLQNDFLFNAFVNLYTPISENKIIYTDEKTIPFFERKNPIKYYFLFPFNFTDAEEEKVSFEKELEASIKTSKKSIVYSRIVLEDEETTTSPLLSTVSKNIFKNLESTFKDVNYIKLDGEKGNINFFCNNLENLERLKYVIQEVIARFYLHQSSVFEDVKNLFEDTDVERGFVEKEVAYKTNFKKLFNIRDFASNEIIGAHKSDSRNSLREFSNFCQCNFQPILLNSEIEAADWNNTVIQIENRYFTCKEKGFVPKYNKNENFLCCKKKDEISPLKEKITEKFKISRKNISTFTPRNTYGELPDEISHFLADLFGKRDLKFYRKGTEERKLKDIFGTHLKDGRARAAGTGDLISEWQQIEEEKGCNIFIFNSNPQNEYSTTEVSPLYIAERNWGYDISRPVFILFLIDFRYDFLVVIDEGMSVNENNVFKMNESQLEKLDFLSKDYYKKYSLHSRVSDEYPSQSNGRALPEGEYRPEGPARPHSGYSLKRENNFLLTNFQRNQLSVQLFLFKKISDRLQNKKDFFKNIIFSKNTYEVDEFLIEFFEKSTLIFSFKKNSTEIFPVFDKILLPFDLQKDLYNLLLHFENNTINFFEDYFENVKSKVLEISSEIIVKIPISMSNFLLGSDLLHSLKEFEEYKNKFIFKDKRLVKNNFVFSSNNPNFIFLPSYHRYNLFFNDINYYDDTLAFNINLYTEPFVVSFPKLAKNIKFLNPNSILRSFRDPVENIIVYEFDIYFEKLVKIFENKGKEGTLHLLYAPFNELKEPFKENIDFINFYINKKKLIFIPFEFVELNE